MPATGVTLGSVFLPAYDDQPADAYGVVWGLTQLDGWFDGWEGTGVTDQRSQADGAWVSPMYAGVRILHVSGTIDAASWDGVTQAWDRLLAQLPYRLLGTLRVSTGEGAVPEQTALVRQHEKPILTERFHNRAEFSLSLMAPDPRKYDSTSRSASLFLPLLTGGIAPPLTPPFTVTGSTAQSQVTLVNDGTVTTYPTFMLSGPCPPATISNLTTGETMRVMDSILGGQTLVIDVLNGTATIDRQARRVLGSWWGLVPGVNEVSFSADGYDATANLLLTFRSAWK